MSSSVIAGLCGIGNIQKCIFPLVFPLSSYFLSYKPSFLNNAMSVFPTRIWVIQGRGSVLIMIANPVMYPPQSRHEMMLLVFSLKGSKAAWSHFWMDQSLTCQSLTFTKNLHSAGNMCGTILSSNYLGLEFHASKTAPSPHHHHHPDFLFNVSMHMEYSHQVPRFWGGWLIMNLFYCKR